MCLLYIHISPAYVFSSPNPGHLRACRRHLRGVEATKGVGGFDDGAMACAKQVMVYL